MPEAVIVATARSPIGRANKGTLKDLRPDDMSAQIVKALMAKVPQVKADDVEDLIRGLADFRRVHRPRSMMMFHRLVSSRSCFFQSGSQAAS